MQSFYVCADVLDKTEQQWLAGQYVTDVDVLRPARNDRLEDGILAVTDGRHLEDGAFPQFAVISMKFGQRPLGLPAVGRQIALNDDL